MLFLQLFDEVYAQIDAVRFEINKIQTAAIHRRVQFACKINEFGERSPELSEKRNDVSALP